MLNKWIAICGTYVSELGDDLKVKERYAGGNGPPRKRNPSFLAILVDRSPEIHTHRELPRRSD